MITDPSDINMEFRSFYHSLYTSEVHLNMDKCKNFLDGWALPSLSREDSGGDDLGRPITLVDLTNALIGMKKGKSPGWDGIPPEFYLTFWNELGQLFVEMNLSSEEKGSFISDANSAIIAVIAVITKPNKDHMLCSNYRPLLILNSEIVSVCMCVS